MTHRRLTMQVIAILSFLALSLAACGDETAPEEAEVGGESISSSDDEGTEADTASDAEADDSDGLDREGWPDKLVFAAVPSEEDEKIQERYATVADILEEDLGIPVDFYQAADYAGVIEAIIADRVDMAGFGPFSYVIAVANGAEIEPVGLAIPEPGEEPGYYSLLITRADNDEIETIDDVVGKRVCFVDPASTSGYLFPIAALLEAGIDPETDITPVMAGGHDASVLAVMNGDCDAGFAYERMVTTILPDAGDIEFDDVKIVAQSPLIAASPTVMRTALPDSLRAELLRIFEEKMNREWALESGICESVETCGQFAENRTWGYVYRDDSFYDGVRAVCAETQAEVCEGIG